MNGHRLFGFWYWKLSLWLWKFVPWWLGRCEYKSLLVNASVPRISFTCVRVLHCIDLKLIGEQHVAFTSSILIRINNQVIDPFCRLAYNLFYIIDVLGSRLYMPVQQSLSISSCRCVNISGQMLIVTLVVGRGGDEALMTLVLGGWHLNVSYLVFVHRSLVELLFILLFDGVTLTQN